MADNGALKVNQHLQVHGFSNIYAVGDCAHVSEPNMAYHAGLHAAVAVSNISSSLSRKQLTSYHPGKRCCRRSSLSAARLMPCLVVRQCQHDAGHGPRRRRRSVQRLQVASFPRGSGEESGSDAVEKLEGDGAKTTLTYTHSVDQHGLGLHSVTHCSCGNELSVVGC